MVLHKGFLSGTRIIVDYFGKSSEDGSQITTSQSSQSKEWSHKNGRGDESGGNVSKKIVVESDSFIENNPNNSTETKKEEIKDEKTAGVDTVDNVKTPLKETKEKGDDAAEKKSPGKSPTNKEAFRDPLDGPPIYVLSHFHSDHYEGIEKGWRPADRNSRIFCTETTAALLKAVFNISQEIIQAQKINTPFVDDIRKPRYVMILIDANHCPGSAIFLCKVLTKSKWLLNTGDLRWYADLEKNLVEAAKKVSAAVVSLRGGATNARGACAVAGSTELGMGMSHPEALSSKRPSTPKKQDLGAQLPSSHDSTPKMDKSFSNGSPVKSLKEKLEIAKTLKNRTSFPRVDVAYIDFSWAHEAFNYIPQKKSAIEKTLRIIDQQFKDGKRIFMYSRCMGDEGMLRAIMGHYPKEQFLFADERRYLELRICGITTPPSGQKQQCYLFTPMHPSLQSVRFFVVRHKGHVRKIVRELERCGVSLAMEMEGGGDCFEIAWSTMWWMNHKHLHFDGAPVKDKWGVYHVLWSMHSSLEELQRLTRFLRPKKLKPVCAVICGDGIDTAEDRFEGMFGNAVSGLGRKVGGSTSMQTTLTEVQVDASSSSGAKAKSTTVVTTSHKVYGGATDLVRDNGATPKKTRAAPAAPVLRSVAKKVVWASDKQLATNLFGYIDFSPMAESDPKGRGISSNAPPMNAMGSLDDDAPGKGKGKKGSIKTSLGAPVFSIARRDPERTRRFRYASDVPLDVAKGRQREYEKKLRAQGQDDQEVKAYFKARGEKKGSSKGPALQKIKEGSSSVSEISTQKSDMIVEGKQTKWRTTTGNEANSLWSSDMERIAKDIKLEEIEFSPVFDSVPQATPKRVQTEIEEGDVQMIDVEQPDVEQILVQKSINQIPVTKATDTPISVTPIEIPAEMAVDIPVATAEASPAIAITDLPFTSVAEFEAAREEERLEIHTPMGGPQTSYVELGKTLSGMALCEHPKSNLKTVPEELRNATAQAKPDDVASSSSNDVALAMPKDFQLMTEISIAQEAKTKLNPPSSKLEVAQTAEPKHESSSLNRVIPALVQGNAVYPKVAAKALAKEPTALAAMMAIRQLAKNDRSAVNLLPQDCPPRKRVLPWLERGPKPGSKAAFKAVRKAASKKASAKSRIASAQLVGSSSSSSLPTPATHAHRSTRKPTNNTASIGSNRLLPPKSQHNVTVAEVIAPQNAEAVVPQREEKIVQPQQKSTTPVQKPSSIRDNHPDLLQADSQDSVKIEMFPPSTQESHSSESASVGRLLLRSPDHSDADSQHLLGDANLTSSSMNSPQLTNRTPTMTANRSGDQIPSLRGARVFDSQEDADVFNDHRYDVFDSHSSSSIVYENITFKRRRVDDGFSSTISNFQSNIFPKRGDG